MGWCGVGFGEGGSVVAVLDCWVLLGIGWV